MKNFLRFIYSRISFIKFRFKLLWLGIKFPLLLRFGTTDIRVFYQVFLRKDYNFKYGCPPNVIIDAGANIGLFSIWIKNRFPASTIIAIEPELENFNILQSNTAKYQKIYCENCGIWNKDIKLKVYDKYNAGSWGFVVEEDAEYGNVNGISIDSLCKKYSINQIDILKLDIETSEKYVFSENYESWLPNVKMIIIELHDWREPGCSKAFFEAINKSFSQYSFSVKGENIIIRNNSRVPE